MKFAIIYSIKDLAGTNIVDSLTKMGFQAEIHSTNKEIIYSEDISDKTKADFIIYASKHSSKQHNKTLSVHATGNWGQAEFGGIKEKVSCSSGFVLKIFFQELNKQAKESKTDYSTTLEATHHGPLVKKPSLFIEMGSSEKEWRDKNAGDIIAKTIISSIDKLNNNNNSNNNNPYIQAIGIGGPHYCPNFNKIQLNSNYSLSHIIPDYCLPLTEDMIKEAFEKSSETTKIILLDWKGLGKSKERQESLDLLNKLNLKFERTSNIEK